MFTYITLGKTFEKQIEIIEEQGRKQVEALEVLKSNIQKYHLKMQFEKIH